MLDKRLCAGRYPVVIMIVDSNYGLVHGNVRVKRIQEMLEEYIAWDVKCRQEVYCSKVGCSSQTENGDSTRFLTGVSLRPLKILITI